MLLKQIFLLLLFMARIKGSKIQEVYNLLSFYMTTKEEFYKRVSQIQSFTSITGRASYSQLTIVKNILSFKRSNTQKDWELNLDDLYEAYTKEHYFNTVILKNYLTRRTYSPSLGLLIKTQMINKEGFKI
jgi:hypothetical protein